MLGEDEKKCEKNSVKRTLEATEQIGKIDSQVLVKQTVIFKN